MERLTPVRELAYPLKRTTMETPEVRSNPSGNEGSSIQDSASSRMERMVARFKKETEDKKKPIQHDKNKAQEAPQASGGPVKSGDFGEFDPEKFKDNSSLEELAKMVRAAGRQNKVDDQFLEGIQRELDKRVGLGLVSDNWRWQFTNYLDGFVVNANANKSQAESRELTRDIEAIIAQRKQKGLTAEEIEASRVALESAFGRKLTAGELDRVTKGLKNSERGGEAFEAQIQTIEKLIDNPNRFNAFESSLSTLSPERLREALRGDGGRLVLGVLLGDIAERDKYYERLNDLLSKDPAGLREGLIALSQDIKRDEESLKPKKVDPEKVRLARIQAQKYIEDQRKKREVTKEEIEAIMANAERGVGLIMGGSDYNENAANIMEQIDAISDEPGEAFTRARDLLADDDLVNVIAEEIYGVDPARINAEKAKFLELKNIDDPRVFKQRYKDLLSDLLRRANEAASDPARAAERAQAQKDAEDFVATGEKTKGGKTFNLRGLEDIVTEDFWRREPRNIEEVAVWIMAGDDRSIWGPDGVYPIFTATGEVDPETGRRKREFQSQNLIRWLRNKSLEHHGDNPNDPLNLLQGVAIETLYKSISILTMKYNKQKYFADENGRPLSDLADEVIGEAWLFGVRRNKNLGYIQAMNSDEKLFEAIVEMSGKNDHTGGSNLATHFKMGEEYDHDGRGLDNKVGDAMLAANHIYRNLADIEKLRQILPANSSMLTLEGFKNASRYLNQENFDADTKGYGNLRIEGNRVYLLDPRTKIRTEIFNSDGKLVSDSNLIKFLNFFPEATPQETNEIFVRELVKQTVAGFVGFDDGMDRGKYEAFLRERKQSLGDAYEEIGFPEYRKLMRMNLEWAETNSWVEQRWNGAAARNDTGYRGYDAWTKMYAQYYRERQSGPRTAGPIGNPHDMQIFRLLTPDMWLAIRTESGESVHEVFEDLHMANLQLYKLKGELTPEQEQQKKQLEERKQEAYAKLKFPRWTESDWAANGVNRQAQVWHNIMNTEDLKFNELVKRDNWGVLRYDRQKFEEVVKDDFIKKRRYAFSSNNAINYGAVTRMRVRAVDPKDPSNMNYFEYKDMYLAEAMFGDVVIGSIRKDWFDGKLEYETADENGKGIKKKSPKKGEEFNPEKHGTFQGYLNSLPARERILKNVCRAGIAAQIKAHREHTGSTERWDAATVRKMLKSLQSMPQYVEDPETGEERRLDGEQFFSDADIKWIQENSGTTRVQLMLEDAGHVAWDAAAEGIPEMFKIFFKDAFS